MSGSGAQAAAAPVPGGDEPGAVPVRRRPTAAPLASAALFHALGGQPDPGRFSERPAASANGMAAAARSFIAARPGDMDGPRRAQLGVAGGEAV